MSNIEFKFKKINSSSSSIIGMNDNQEKIIYIPSEDDFGLTVTKIDSSAFKGNNNIEEVFIPDSVKNIGESAFEKCTNLKKLRLPSTMIEIGRHAFKYCDIRKLILPELSKLGFAAFSKNKDGIFAIKEKITCVQSHAFNECEKLVCLLPERTTKKWDYDWDAGAKNFSDDEEDLPDIEYNETSNNESEKNSVVMDSENEATNKQELFDQNIEVRGAKGIVYAKVIKLSFPVKHLLITKIPVLQSAQLSFYQKFIILLLEKGVKANDSTELSNSLSNMLNVSRTCVEDFVNYLVQNSYLDYNNRTKKYSLCKEMHFTIKPELNNAMFAELDTKLAECNKIVYLKEIQKCYLEEDFNNGVFKRKGNSTNSDEDLDYDEIEQIKSQNEYIRDLLSRYFEKTNMHIKHEFSFDVKSVKSNDYSIEFDALLQYSYSKEKKQSKLFNTIVLKDNFLPKNFINSLAEQYKVDDDLPRFLGMQDQFYEKVIENSDEMDKTVLSIENANEQLRPLEEDLESTKVQLNELKKSNKQKKKEVTNEVDEVKAKIKDKENEISMNESLINKSTIDDEALINNLKKTIKDLKKAKEKLEHDLSSKTNDVAELEQNLKKSEENLSKVIDEKEEVVSKAKAIVRNYEKELKDQGSDLTNLLTKNKNKTNETIKSVIQKYPSEKNIFNRYVTDIAIWLDSAISASECNAVDEIARCIDTIREMYRKVIQIVFDTLLGKKEMTLGSYMNDSFNQIELEKLFKSRGVNVDIKQRLIIFHDVANAIGHLAENGPKKEANIKRLTEFKKMSSMERSRIILAIPDFFNSITFKNKEVEAFVNKLTIR